MAVYDVTPAQKAALIDAKDVLEQAVNSRKVLWDRLSPQKRSSYKLDPDSCPDPVTREILKFYKKLRKGLGDADG